MTDSFDEKPTFPATVFLSREQSTMARYAVRWIEGNEQVFIGDAGEVLRELGVYAHSSVHWEAIQKAMADLEIAEIGTVADLIDCTVEKIC